MNNREKQIMEMEEVIRAENEKMFNFRDGYICTPHDQAKALYKLKYRNIREARKEIAKEVLIDLKKEQSGFLWKCRNLHKTAFGYSLKKHVDDLG